MPKFKIILVATKFTDYTEDKLWEYYNTHDVQTALNADLESAIDEPDLFLGAADNIEIYGKVVE